MNIYLQSLLSIFFPRCCPICQQPLSPGEEYICTSCNINLPRTNDYINHKYQIEKLFWGKFPIEKATSFFYYRKGSDFKQILHRLKYGGEKEIGEMMGRYIGEELKSTNFFQQIDIIIPIPLHKKKEKERGYNQSVWIAKGIAHIIHLPIDTHSVIRQKYTETQTRKSHYERIQNVENIFSVPHPETLQGKHILLVDDVLTTGATISSCAEALQSVPGIRISVLTLAIAE